jgi:type IV secretory pathway component VirB8
VRETKEETKKNMKNKKNIDWTSYNKLTAEPIKARINRLQRHNNLLGYAIAGLLGASAALTFVIAHMMITGPAWTW